MYQNMAYILAPVHIKRLNENLASLMVSHVPAQRAYPIFFLSLT